MYIMYNIALYIHTYIHTVVEHYAYYLHTCIDYSNASLCEGSSSQFLSIQSV